MIRSAEWSNAECAAFCMQIQFASPYKSYIQPLSDVRMGGATVIETWDLLHEMVSERYRCVLVPVFSGGRSAVPDHTENSHKLIFLP